MAVLSEFDAWAHSECGLTHQELARYTPQEITRLQLGYLRREHDVGSSSGSGEGSVAARKRKFRQRHQQKNEEMFGDRGFQ